MKWKIYENPVVKFLLGIVQGNLGSLGSGIETGIGKKLKERQKYKEKIFLETIFSDESITLKDVEDVDFLFEFAMTYNAVMKLLQNEKVIYFANLLKNTALKPIKDTDTFQESIEHLCSLSYREIKLLFLLDQCQKEYCMKYHKDIEEDIQSIINIWDIFIREANEKFRLSKEMIESIFTGIERTGFCKVKNVVYPGATAKCYCTSCYFEQFSREISCMEEWRY